MRQIVRNVQEVNPQTLLLCQKSKKNSTKSNSSETTPSYSYEATIRKMGRPKLKLEVFNPRNPDYEKILCNNLGFIKDQCRNFVYGKDDADLLYSYVVETLLRIPEKFKGSTDHDFRCWSYGVIRCASLNKYNKDTQIKTIPIIEGTSRELIVEETEEEAILNEELAVKKEETLSIIFKLLEKEFSSRSLELYKKYFIDRIDGSFLSREFNLSKKYISQRVYLMNKFLRNPETIELIKNLGQIRKGASYAN